MYVIGPPVVSEDDGAPIEFVGAVLSTEKSGAELNDLTARTRSSVIALLLLKMSPVSKSISDAKLAESSVDDQ